MIVSPGQIIARRFTSSVFESPMDVKAGKILGNIAVTWSFAIRELPPGDEIALPPDLTALVSSADENPARSVEIERALTGYLKDSASSASLSGGSN